LSSLPLCVQPAIRPFLNLLFFVALSVIPATMIDADLHDQAYQFFQQEALELLQTLENGLLTLRAEYGIPKIHDLMRASHSIKGGAASVDLPGIQKIAHKLEDVFRALYRREDPLDDELEEALLHAYDCLRLPLIEQIETGSFDAEAAWNQAEPIFTLLEAVLSNEMGADVELPTSMELGIDIVAEVFTGDIQRGIDRLTAVLQQPEGQPVAGEIRSTAEVFAGIGDLLGLPGFKAIAQQTLESLDAQPHNALTIGQVAVENFCAAQATVLAGDRTEGGSPSPALLALATAETATPDVLTLEDYHLLDDVAQALSPENSQEGSEALAFNEPPLSWDVNTNLLESMFGAGLSLEDSSILNSDSAADILPGEETLPTESDWIPATESAFIAEQPDSPAELSDLASSLDQLEDLFGAVDLAHESIFVLEPSPDIADIEPNNPSLGAAPLAEEQTLIPQPNPLPPAPTSSPVPLQDPVEATQITAPQSVPSRQPASSSQPGETMRVDLARLDRLNNLVGELITQENGSLLHSQQLQSKVKGLQSRFQQFEQLSKSLQDWMDKSQAVAVRHESVSVRDRAQSAIRPALEVETTDSTPASAPETAAVFDALEMDSYSNLYTFMQEALEEIAQMGEVMGDMVLITHQSQQIQRQKQQTLKQVRNDLLWSRMMPLSDMLQRFPRMVRDMSNKYQKRVNFKTTGATTLVDKAILEKLYDPLVHLVRNAFDHGADSPEERAVKGKVNEATIEIRAYYRGNQTLIEVRDDGKGINPQKVRAALLEKGLLSPEAAAALSNEQVFQYLFAPGFSTKEEVNDISGRGMGLSSVQEQIKALKGSIAIASDLDQGTTFTIRLPLTLNIAKLMVFSVDAYTMAIPVDTLTAIVMAPDQDIQTIQGRQFYRYQEQLIPLFPPSVFASHYPLPRGLGEKQRTMTLPKGNNTPLLVITNGTEIIALEVDEILTEQELVIKPFGSILQPPPYLYGCTILGDGALVPVIDGAVLISQWQQQDASQSTALSLPIPTQAAAIATNVKTILVIDDSLTTRKSLVMTLQKHGYHVLQAADGREALVILQHEPNIHAVFSDVEMPNMNGFEFLTTCRKDYTAAALPVIMLTSRSGEKHKKIAQVLGANAYITKPYVEKELIQTLKDALS
jgi:two-component system, chemotaxis family, sensor histidine kinase and response regulator PixL